jgi:hypothetical protein
LNVFANQEIAAVVTAADFDDAVGFAP